MGLHPSATSALSILSAMAATSCAQPIAGLWPAPAGSLTHRVIVSVDTWHSVIGIYPHAAHGHETDEELEEWSYAERDFYLYGDTGCSGTMRAWCWPSAGVVQVRRGGPPYSERTPQPPARQWSFQLGEEAFHRLLEWLHRSRASVEPISFRARSLWYESSSDYHGCHQCHHWVARALRAAGFPIWSCYAFTKGGLEAQLDRCARLAGESARQPVPEEDPAR